MKFSAVLVLLLTWHEVTPISVNLTEPTQTKTKRGLIDQTLVYGEASAFKPIHIYVDNVAAAAQPELANYYAPKYDNAKFTTEPKVTAQQVLYEYQQTPHNSVSNVHVNQQFQTTPQHQSGDVRLEAPQQVVHKNYPNLNQAQQTHNTNQASAETVAMPVHHSTYVQHSPYVPHQIQTQVNPYLLGKYVYHNGKYVYYPQPVPNPYYQSHLQHQQQIQQQLLQQQLHQQPQQFKQPHVPTRQYHVPKPPQQHLMPPSATAPMSFQYNQQINKPVNVQPNEKPIKEAEETEDPPKADLEEDEEDEAVEEKGEVQNEPEEIEEDEDEEENSNYRNGEEEDDDEKFGRYTFDDDVEEEGNARYQNDAEEEEDESKEDSNREPSSYLKRINKRKPNKPTNKYNKNTNYKVKEGYKTKSRYSNSKVKPSKKSKTDTLKPKKEYQAYTFTKTGNGKPKIEMIEGKYSQNIPVAVKQVYREKWFITSNHDQ